MTAKRTRRYADWITTHSTFVVVAVLALTVLVAAGAAMGDADSAGVGEFDVEAPETDAADFVRRNYGGEDGIVAQVVLRNESGDVLTRESLLDGLRLQQAIRDDPEIAPTLADPGLIGIENVVGTAAVYADASADGGSPPSDAPSLSAQIDALESRSPAEVEQLLARVLDPDGQDRIEQDPYGFLPREYEPGETRAQARLTFLVQVDDSAAGEDPQAAYDAQVAIADMVEQRFPDAFVFGEGVQNDVSSRATGDSFTIITPFALVLIVLVLGITYRDVLDILLAFVGIGVVMAWLAGLMGWLAIPMNVILIAVPFLLIGLSIDYALHVVMRYREARAGTLEEDSTKGQSGDASDRSIRTAMALGVGSVVLALAAATVSTGVGFLSNVVSPLPAIQDFAVLSAGGIFATFVAFGLFLPALKVEVDGVVETRLGWSRAKPAFGVERGSANAVLERLGAVTLGAPVVIVLVALLLATAGAYGATTIDTEFNEADFLPTDAPEWTKSLPGPLAPDTYTIAEDFAYLSDNFQLRGDGGQSQVLIRGDSVASGSLLSALEEATGTVPEVSSIQVQPDGRAALDGPHTAIRSVAGDNETFAAIVDQHDTDGDGLPEENVETVYAALFDADPATADQVLSRGEDGEITSARLVLSVRSSESAQTIAADTGAFADRIEGGVAGVSAVETGSTVTTAVIQDALLETLVEAFVVTLVVILVFLTGLFRVRYGSWSLGPLVLAPVVVSLAWLLGAMAALDISFNSETAVITSLAIGLGVDYSIHAGERFMAEREERPGLEDALRRTITGTGGTLLASAATTAAAFGVLALALAPPLRRFGIVTGLAIVFAFVAVVTMLPGLLVVRERLLERHRA